MQVLSHQWTVLLKDQKFLLLPFEKLAKWKSTLFSSLIRHRMHELAISSDSISNHSSIDGSNSSIKFFILHAFLESKFVWLNILLRFFLVLKFLFNDSPVSVELLLFTKLHFSYLADNLVCKIVVVGHCLFVKKEIHFFILYITIISYSQYHLREW